MALRPAVTALAAFALAACAVGSSDGAPGLGESGDGGAIGASDGGRGDDGSTLTGPSGPTGATGPGVLDAGPPAVVGGDDAGETDAATAPDTGGALPDGGCSTLAQCPYESATNVAAVACTNGACVITCNGENYDVNGLLADGCEVPATCPVCNGTATCPVDDHSEATATYVGSFPCDDSSSAQDLTGTIPSDNRAHSPAVNGFITLTGSTPGFFNIYGSGGTFCEDDANFTLTMTAPTQEMPCYTLTLITDNQTQTCNTDDSGTCAITNGSGSYTDGSTIYVEVSKTSACAAATTMDDGTFTITGHL